MRIRWDSGSVNSYRMGKEDKFDLALAPSELQPKARETDSKELLADAQITVGERIYILYAVVAVTKHAVELAFLSDDNSIITFDL